MAIVAQIDTTFRGPLFDGDDDRARLARVILHDATFQAANDLRNEVLRFTPTRDTGALQGSIFARQLPIRGERLASICGTEYRPALALEFGREPGAPGPPYQPIFEWVVRRGIDFVDDETGEALGPEATAWIIRDTIHRAGFAPPNDEGWQFFQQGEEAAEEQIARRLEEAVEAYRRFWDGD